VRSEGQGIGKAFGPLSMGKFFSFAFAVILGAQFSALQTASADKLCLKTTVDKKSLKTKHRSIVTSSCPAGYTELADSGTFTGPAGTQGSAGATGPAGAVLKLYDSADTEISPVINVGCQQFFSDNQRKPFEWVTVLLTLENRTYPLCASTEEFVATTDVAFASPSCTGQAFLFPYAVPSSASGLFDAAHVTAAGSDRILYRPDYAAGQQLVTRHSSRNSEGTCSDSTATEMLYPAVQVLDLGGAYVGPFEVR